MGSRTEKRKKNATLQLGENHVKINFKKYLIWVGDWNVGNKKRNNPIITFRFVGR